MKSSFAVRSAFRRASAKLTAFAVLASAAVVTSPVFAAIDTTDAIAEVDNAKTFITAVGLAVLSMIFVAKGVRWARKAG